MSYFEVSHISKSFGKLEVLHDVSFTLEKGEVLAIIGSSGSGKTTLLRCLNFLEKPNTGKITVNNEVIFDSENIEKLNHKDIRYRNLKMGLVFQNFNLFPHMNVLKNITLSPSLLLKENLVDYKQIDEITEEAYRLLDVVGLRDRWDYYPYQLSGGQCQRVAIARALALKPEILCFDEPTSALDPELTGEVLKVIKSLKGKDRTMIIVTHEMNFARKVADKVIYMADGYVEEVGTPEDVFLNPQSEKTKAFLSSSNERNE